MYNDVPVWIQQFINFKISNLKEVKVLFKSLNIIIKVLIFLVALEMLKGVFFIINNKVPISNQ